MPTREAFLKWCHSQMGAPYRWGGKGLALWTQRGLIVSDWADANSHPIASYDCAGFITSGLHALGGPDWRAGKGANSLAETLPRVAEADKLPGDVACYGPPHVTTHVMVLADLGRVIGACGGSSDTTTLELATRHAARVKLRPSPNYRADLKWWVRLPLSD